MKQSLYSVLDKKLGAYNTPFCAHNDEVAQRSFGSAANSSNTTIFEHPEDFDLYKIAEVDLENGVVSPLDKPFWICSALTVTAARRSARQKYEQTTANFDPEDSVQ